VKTTRGQAGHEARAAHSRARARGPWIGPTGIRLALAIVIICLTVIGTVIGIAGATVAADIDRLAAEQGADLTQALALAASAAHKPAGWDREDLTPVIDLVGHAGAAVRIRGRDGHVIRSSPNFASIRTGLVHTRAVVDDGKYAGSVTVKFDRRGLAGAISHYESLRWHIRFAAAGAAVLFALIVSVLVSRKLTAPVERLIGAVRAMGAGDSSARVGELRGVHEVRELSAAFDQMADSVAAEAQLRRDMAADLAHELRAPIAVLQAGLEAIHDGLAEPTTENLDSLRDEVVRLAQMADDLRVLASGQSAALKVEFATHDLAGIAAEAADSLSAVFEAAGVSLNLRLTSVDVRCDARRIYEVAANLLSNAAKFTPAGGSVTLETEPMAETLAMLRVSDTGIGIPADELPHVSQRFFRGERAADISGSGIGLAIVDQLARLHHGRVDIVSDPGQGTQVTVTLPKVTS
jgi:two-component system, OmpR family, sensor histidine kinase BaeS